MKAFRAVFYVREQVNGSFRLVRHSTKWYGSREELEAAHDLTNPNWECVQIKERGKDSRGNPESHRGKTLSENKGEIVLRVSNRGCYGGGDE